MTDLTPNSAQQPYTSDRHTPPAERIEAMQRLNRRTVPIVFTGKKAEFFKIWLVNALLSIITLGIYSAWAKVRNTQYLYGHTQIDGHRLSFLAKPMQILIGRIIAAVVFALYVLISGFVPLISTVLLLLASPWLMNQAIRFSMRNTAYRNVRFGFHGTYGQAFGHFILLPLVAAFSGFLAAPWVFKRIQQYIYQNISFGGKPFQLPTSTAYYYKAALAVIGVGAVLALFFFAVSSAVDLEYQLHSGALNVLAILPVIMVSYLVGLSLIGAVFYSMLFNHILQHLHIEETVAFEADLSAVSYTWLSLSNSLLLIVTLGLAYPITQIRKNALLAQATRVQIYPAVDQLVNTIQDDEGAFGEEAAGVFDVDLSLT